MSLPSDKGAPIAPPVSWAALLTGNTLFWLAYSLASTATRVPSLSAPLADGLQAWVLTMPQWVAERLFIDAAAYDPAFWRDHPVLARTPTDRAAIASFERTGAFGRLADALE